MANQTGYVLEVVFFITYLALAVTIIYSLASNLNASEPTALSMSSSVIYLFVFLFVMLIGIKIYKKRKK